MSDAQENTHMMLREMAEELKLRIKFSQEIEMLERPQAKMKI